ncbi:MAG: hypothetical protein HQL29_00645 [Candidatus Omnitrophica bacterium]|nr:hypothetical protein [Candidatus Omnitrophota bacterium]
MKVLVRKQNSPVKRFYVDLTEEKIIEEMKSFISKCKYEKAIKVALSKGKVLREITQEEEYYLDAQLILTNSSVHYDLM